MAGIYIHIPFCSKACAYCNFHFSTNLTYTQNMVDAICQEIAIQKKYLGPQPIIQSIYFGGGTPSILTRNQLQQILETLRQYFSFTQEAEITLEANPDNIYPENIKTWHHIGINRLSIGIQSFNNHFLKLLGRNHDREQALNAIDIARQNGIENLSFDLIYGIPSDTHAHWEEDLAIATRLKSQHISAYQLTIEPRTKLAHQLKKGEFKAASEAFVCEQFTSLYHTLSTHGYEQYEISNFALKNYEAIHNSNYWLNHNYLGLGPSAHSYNGKYRQWNIANNQKYMKAMESGDFIITKEELSKNQRFNEYILTRLRTKWGISMEKLMGNKQWWLKNNIDLLHQFINKKLIKKEGHQLYLTLEGKLLADEITLALMLDE